MTTAISVLLGLVTAWFLTCVALVIWLSSGRPADEDWLADQPKCCDFHAWESELTR